MFIALWSKQPSERDTRCKPVTTGLDTERIFVATKLGNARSDNVAHSGNPVRPVFRGRDSSLCLSPPNARWEEPSFRTAFPWSWPSSAAPSPPGRSHSGPASAAKKGCEDPRPTDLHALGRRQQRQGGLFQQGTQTSEGRRPFGLGQFHPVQALELLKPLGIVSVPLPQFRGRGDLLAPDVEPGVCPPEAPGPDPVYEDPGSIVGCRVLVDTPDPHDRFRRHRSNGSGRCFRSWRRGGPTRRSPRSCS